MIWNEEPKRVRRALGWRMWLVRRVPRITRAIVGCALLGLMAACADRAVVESDVVTPPIEQQDAGEETTVAADREASDPGTGADTSESSIGKSVPDSVDAPVVDPLSRFFHGFPEAALAQQHWDTTGADAWVRSRLAAMTLREKIGQLLIVRLDRNRNDPQPRYSDTRAASEYAVGGFLVSRLLPPEDVAAEVIRLQGLANIPFFFAADYERGVGRFSNNFTELPSNMAIGATADTTAAAAAGILTAIESRSIGVNLLFAPVVDVNNNPLNPIINTRSYGEDPGLVADLASSYVKAAESFGVLTTMKHFPGHGNSSVDTHTLMGLVAGSLEELRTVELVPYERMLNASRVPAAVMMAHLGVHALDDSDLPSTLSPAVTGYLRQLAGSDRLIITDDVRMGALQSDYSLAERVVGPLVAGADIILTPESIPGTFTAIESAVKSGKLSESRIDESVRRILLAKSRIGLHRNALPNDPLWRDLGRYAYGQHIADSIAAESVTIVKACAPSVASPFTLIQLSNFTGSESIDRAMQELADSLSVSPENELRLSSAPTAGVMRWIREIPKDKTIVVALHLRLQSGRGSAGLADGHASVLNAVFETPHRTAVALFGNPYVAAELDAADCILAGYDQTVSTVRAVANVLQGRTDAPGKLPVTVGYR